MSSRKYSDYQSLISEGNALSQSIKEKMEHYKQVADGVRDFNVAEETESYIKDGLDTAKDVATEFTIGVVKKFSVKTLDKLDDYLLKKSGKTTAETTEETTAESTAETGAESTAESTAETTAETTAESTAESVGENVGENVAEDVAENVGEDLAEGLAEGGADVVAEAVGTALDFTGIGAVLGVPIQIVAGIGMAVGAVHSGIDIWHDMEDIFGHRAKTNNQAPPPPPTFVQNRIAPTLET